MTKTVEFIHWGQTYHSRVPRNIGCGCTQSCTPMDGGSHWMRTLLRLLTANLSAMITGIERLAVTGRMGHQALLVTLHQCPRKGSKYIPIWSFNRPFDPCNLKLLSIRPISAVMEGEQNGLPFGRRESASHPGGTQDRTPSAVRTPRSY